MTTRFKSQIEQEYLPLDKDWKKNLETHKIVDLLADREAESVRQWLAAHPEVDVVSRDRGKMYIDGATLGAPQATQVADRWHILSNLGDAVEEFLIRMHIRLEDEKASPGECHMPDKPLSSFWLFLNLSEPACLDSRMIL